MLSENHFAISFLFLSVPNDDSGPSNPSTWSSSGPPTWWSNSHYSQAPNPPPPRMRPDTPPSPTLPIIPPNPPSPPPPRMKPPSVSPSPQSPFITSPGPKPQHDISTQPSQIPRSLFPVKGSGIPTPVSLSNPRGSRNFSFSSGLPSVGRGRFGGEDSSLQWGRMGRQSSLGATGLSQNSSPGKYFIFYQASMNPFPKLSWALQILISIVYVSKYLFKCICYSFFGICRYVFFW